jgi:ISXO2-like transposase domain
MSLINIIRDFPDNSSCELDFKLKREKEGVVCKRCCHKEHYWLQYKKQWQCKLCNFRTTLKSGTIMENSKMSMYNWYMVMAFMGDVKKGFSSKEIQKQLGAKQYKSVLLLTHKIRTSMGYRDDKYILKGEIELDEGYFSVDTTEQEKRNSKAGRGSERVQNVLVMAESTPIEDLENGGKSTHCRYYKMKVVNSHKAEDINTLVQKNIDKTCIVFSDKSTSYVDIANFVEGHCVEISSKKTTIETLKWVHVAISNAKKIFGGVFHHMKSRFLQNYLNEFCYKLNRRYFKDRLFERLTLAVATMIYFR